MKILIPLLLIATISFQGCSKKLVEQIPEDNQIDQQFFKVADMDQYLEQKPEPKEIVAVPQMLHEFHPQLKDQSMANNNSALYLSKSVMYDTALSGGAIRGYSGMHALSESFMGDIVHNTEEYDYKDETGFKSVEHDPLSTFSIDVDTASYANVRRFLNNNRLPPKDAVRIEEMINYFNFDYEEPKSKVPFSITTEASTCPWNKDNKLVMVGIQGKTGDMNKLPASNLVFLIDTSGSMNQDNKLGLLKSAFKILVDKLRPQDTVSIVAYAGSAGLILDSAKGDDKTSIISALDNLNAGGSTAGGAGIQLAYDTAKKNFKRHGNNRVILATDGDFNVGVSSTGELTRLVEEKKEDGIFLTVLGFGTGNYKDNRMESLADKGNGNYSYIDNLMEAKKVLSNDLTGTLFTIAKDVKIQIEFNPTVVKSYRLIGYENRRLNKEDFNNDKKDAGELGAGHNVTALYEIVTQDSEANPSSVDKLKYQIFKTVKSDDFMTVKLRYKEPDGEKSKLIEHEVTLKDLEKTMTDNIVFASAVVEFGLLLRDSEYKSNANVDKILERVKKSVGQDNFGYRTEFIRILEMAKLLGLK